MKIHLDWKYLLTDFHGRIPRQHFWIAFGAVVIIEILCHLIANRIQGERLSAIVDLAFVYPELAITAKRAHDRNLPTWVPGIFFAGGALIDFITILGFAGSRDNPSALLLVLTIPLMIFGLALLIDFGFRRGTSGPNRYGPDPLANRP
jgi:uncharacterized membrane protein YhaH (DUF805 family)